jgi:hypothetical protein
VGGLGLEKQLGAAEFLVSRPARNQLKNADTWSHPPEPTGLSIYRPQCLFRRFPAKKPEDGQDRIGDPGLLRPAHHPARHPRREGLFASLNAWKGKEMPSPSKVVVKSYLTSEEYKSLKENAGRARLSVSAYVKTVCLGHEVKSAVDKSGILDLAKVSADLGRLGGLLKLALSEKAIDRLRGNSLLEDLSRTRKLLEDKVRKL